MQNYLKELLSVITTGFLLWFTIIIINAFSGDSSTPFEVTSYKAFLASLNISAICVFYYTVSSVVIKKILGGK